MEFEEFPAQRTVEKAQLTFQKQIRCADAQWTLDKIAALRALKSRPHGLGGARSRPLRVSFTRQMGDIFDLGVVERALKRC